MRGQDTQQAGMFSYLSPEERVPVTHPLRPIRQYRATSREIQGTISARPSSLRASNVHLPSVRVLRARRAPGRSYPIHPSSLFLSSRMGAD